MQTPKYLLAQHLRILNIILPPFCTLVLSYNTFSLYSFIAIQNILYYSYTFLYFLYKSLTCIQMPHYTFYFTCCPFSLIFLYPQWDSKIDLLPRIKLIITDKNLPLILEHMQSPVHGCFTMKIYK